MELFIFFLVLTLTTTEELEEADQLLENILQNGNYSSGTIPPTLEGVPMRVKLNILIRSIEDVNDDTMALTLQSTIWQEWNDPRLEFNHSEPVTLAGVNNRIWTPDLFFPNEKSSYFPQHMKPNTYLRVFPNGTILHSTRLSITLSCPMNLRFFPLDKQQCYLQLSSYSFTVDKLEFLWRSEKPVLFFAGGYDQLPKFKLRKYTVGNCSDMVTKTFSGAYTCLSIKLGFNRQIGYYFNQVYVPTGMYVMISWLSFWLGINVLEARLALGITTLLTLSTQLSGISQTTPAVSYTKALDVWIGVCLLFVLSSIIEVAYLMYLVQRKRNNTRNNVVPIGSPVSVINSGNNVRTGSEEEKCKSKLARIDMRCRKIFPVAFAFFNTFYWTFFLNFEQES